ncbi:MAG TPA: hypothetical protein VIY48_03170 [Candidatus Paceibacterota bacterium]
MKRMIYAGVAWVIVIQLVLFAACWGYLDKSHMTIVQLLGIPVGFFLGAVGQFIKDSSSEG